MNNDSSVKIDAPQKEQVTGVILAGGRARRMGGQDKGLLPFAGRPLIQWVIEAFAPQVSCLMINANRNRASYGKFGFPVIADEIADFQGPLAGFAAAMSAATTPWIATVPCDGPCPARDLVERLCDALRAQGAEIAVATDGQRTQPVYALLPVALAPSLREFLASAERKIDRWYARHRVAYADLSDRPDGFANINTLEDARQLGRGRTTCP